MTAGQTASPYGWRLGSLRGVPVYLGRSWPVIALVVVVTFGPTVPQPDTGERGGAFGFSVGIAYALLLLMSVLAHEGAHAAMAARLGHRVDRVVADLWGGHTVYDGGTSRPGSSAAIAVVGPVANLAIAAAGYGLQGLAGYGVAGLLLWALFVSNLFVGVFNLLPGLPLDGGFVVDALVWKVSGSRHTGLLVAGWLGRVLVAGLVGVLILRPLVSGETPSLYTIVWAGLIGAFLWSGATSAIRAGSNGRAMERVPVAQVLRPVMSVGADEPLSETLRRVASFAGSVVVWARDGRPAGLLDLDVARTVGPVDLAAGVTNAAVLLRQPAGWVVTVDPRSDSASLVEAVVDASGDDGSVPSVVLVCDPAGRPLGSVSLDELDAAVRAQR